MRKKRTLGKYACGKMKNRAKKRDFKCLFAKESKVNIYLLFSSLTLFKHIKNELCASEFLIHLSVCVFIMNDFCIINAVLWERSCGKYVYMRLLVPLVTEHKIFCFLSANEPIAKLIVSSFVNKQDEKKNAYINWASFKTKGSCDRRRDGDRGMGGGLSW